MNGYMPYNQTQSYQATQYFPQPQGNVYLVNNSLEVANVPMGAGLSMVLCPSEGLMYLKTLQGGATATITPTAVGDTMNFAFATIIKVPPSCCSVDNTANLTLVNTGVAAIFTNVNINITKLC